MLQEIPEAHESRHRSLTMHAGRLVTIVFFAQLVLPEYASSQGAYLEYGKAGSESRAYTI
ncbi:MAG TPA: hypothetical protein VIS48_00705 [Candidatus Kryptonia bacterium]